MSGSVALMKADQKTPLDTAGGIAVGSANPDGTVGPQAYWLLGNAATPVTVNTVGSWVGPLTAGYYTVTVDGTFGSGTFTLERKGLDGSTAVSTGLTLTAQGNLNIQVPQGASIRGNLTGSTSPSLRASVG
jgi:hypothetical protein